MLGSMTPELQKQCEDMEPSVMLTYLRSLFASNARSERYEISKKLFRLRISEGSSVQAHVLKMIEWIRRLDKLGFELSDELSTDLILQSLPDSFNPFILNYNMNKIESSLDELLNMLVVAEGGLQKEAAPVMIVGRANNGKRKGPAPPKKKKKTKLVKGQAPVRGKKKGEKDSECHRCKKKGHWARNCRAILTEGIFVIDLCLSMRSSSWVLDTRCASHICNSLQMLANKRRLGKKEVEMRMGNGALVCAKAVGTARLTLPSRHILELKNCYYVPDIVKNIISVSRLSDTSYTLTTTANGCSILFNGLSVAYGHLVNGLYVLDTLSDVLQVTRTNSNEMNPSYLWHCRLGHIGEKRISHLHSSGYLNSFEYKPFDTCERCIMGKMTKAPFGGQGERASELLELVQTDVCGPLSKEAKGGYSYFITFTDDFSRFGFVYLMRHKSEAFEKFEEYRNEVEKQTGKSIKALRLDRGGEYLSQEFVAYLKHHGIVSQWTPPYTPQHNGVSERRNRTLLDMVRSMMSRSELPIYLWGYALETAAYLVNRVPSKSVSSTPYEIWKGRKLN